MCKELYKYKNQECSIFCIILYCSLCLFPSVKICWQQEEEEEVVSPCIVASIVFHSMLPSNRNAFLRSFFLRTCHHFTWKALGSMNWTLSQGLGFHKPLTLVCYIFVLLKRCIFNHICSQNASSCSHCFPFGWNTSLTSVPSQAHSFL